MSPNYYRHCYYIIVIYCYILLYIVIYCYILLYIVIYCYILLYIVIYCYILLYIVIYCYILLYIVIYCYILLYIVIYCYILLYIVIYCYILRSTKRHRDRGEPETGQANRPRHRENNGRSQERPPPSVHFQGNGQRPLPQRTRSTSSASQQNRTTTPSLGGYTNSSSEVSFLVRMIQDMKSDFQKDLNHLRESMLPQQTRWNPQALQPSHHQPAPPTQQGVHIQPQHHMLNQPLWNHPTPLFSS